MSVHALLLFALCPGARIGLHTTTTTPPPPPPPHRACGGGWGGLRYWILIRNKNADAAWILEQPACRLITNTPTERGSGNGCCCGSCIRRITKNSGSCVC